MKKILSIFLSLILVISFSIPVAAASNGTEKTKISINEYTLLKNLNDADIANMNSKNNAVVGKSTQTNPDNTIISEDSAQISKTVTKAHLIQEYKEKIYQLKGWSETQLANVGYNQQQINAIKNFDGSEELMMLAATSVDVSIEIIDVNATTNGTTATISASFNCAGIQSNWFLDVFGVGWSYPLTMVSSSGTVRYKTADGWSTTDYHAPINAGSLYGQQMKFYKYKTIYAGDPSGIHHGSYYIQNGSMTIELKSNTMVYDIAALATYGYTTFGINPSVSFSANGTIGAGFSFTSGTTSVGEAYKSY